ncbi:kinase-like domain-containing protein [Amylostereum chailletii]|nr:kinase-like domain-containing protein [Amylostereum chailletii]
MDQLQNACRVSQATDETAPSKLFRSRQCHTEEQYQVSDDGLLASWTLVDVPSSSLLHQNASLDITAITVASSEPQELPFISVTTPVLWFSIPPPPSPSNASAVLSGCFTPEQSTGNFTPISLLHASDTSCIFRVQECICHKEYALRVLSKAKLEEQGSPDARILSEQELLRRMDGIVGVLPLLASWHDDAFWFFLTAHPTYDRLSAQLGKCDEAKAAFYLAEILVIMDKIRKAGGTYDRVELEDIFFDNAGHLLLANLGKIQPCDNSISGARPSSDAEVKSLGVMAHTLLLGHRPFFLANGRTAPQADFSFKTVGGRGLSLVARDFLRKAFNTNALKRPNLAQLRLHPFFDGIDWNAVQSRSSPAPPVPRQHVPSLVTERLGLPSGMAYTPSTDPYPTFAYTSPLLSHHPRQSYLAKIMNTHLRFPRKGVSRKDSQQPETAGFYVDDAVYTSSATHRRAAHAAWRAKLRRYEPASPDAFILPTCGHETREKERTSGLPDSGEYPEWLRRFAKFG